MFIRLTLRITMLNHRYQKLAGTSAVFVLIDYPFQSPVNRDGPVWTGQELHIEDLPIERTIKPHVASPMVLEGLESYEAPSAGDFRVVDSMQCSFVYLERSRCWVQAG